MALNAPNPYPRWHNETQPIILPWNKNTQAEIPTPSMSTCQYCAKWKADAYLISSCPNEHLMTVRICNHCYTSFLAGNAHMCLSCNRVIMDWAAKLDQGKNLRSGTWITSWEKG